MSRSAAGKVKHWWAALASFLVVGLGQIVKKEGDKGLKMMLSFYLGVPAALYTALLINGYLFLLALALCLLFGIIMWTYNVLDALLKQ